MTSSAQRLMEEMREERAALRINIVLTALTAGGLLAGVVATFAHAPTALTTGLFAVAYLAGGVPAGWDALKELRHRHLDIDLLMVLAALAAAAVGEVRDGAILLFLFSLAGTLEDYAMGNTKRAVVSLMKLRPDKANVMREDGTVETVEVSRVAIGERVVVRPGERLPVDGRVLQGGSAVDQSPITGESVPVDKAVGDDVFAGSMNGHGALEVEVTKEAGHSTLARMIELTTQAQAQRSPSERFSEWFGQRYTVFVLLGSAVALGVFLLIGLPRWEAFYKAATLLVVASPCAIVISVPAAVLSALAAAARMGVLFKGGGALEDFGSTDVIAFDKTGTLTEGKMHVTDVVGLSVSDAELLAAAAAVEQTSEHPLARSILEEAQEENLRIEPVTDTQALPGKGIRVTRGGERYWAGNRKLAAEVGAELTGTLERAVQRLEGEGKTTILVGKGGNHAGTSDGLTETPAEVLGVIGIGDTVRASARDTLQALQAAGVGRLAMLTGDHEAVARNVGSALGLSADAIHAGLLPEQKVERVRELNRHGRVTFVGDGVNDAAALATASVGVAMGTAGSDVALEAADVALLSDDLRKLPHAYALARKANRIIKQNLAFALGIMLFMVIVTIFFFLPLPLGVLGHEGGTILVVSNGLRLLAYRPKGAAGAPEPAPKPARGLAAEG
ncbi:MAG: cation-translocating P-type ATPase [Deinococcales bacterium]